MGPSAVAITAIANAWPNAANRMTGWSAALAARTDPAPPTTRTNAPTSSPIAFLHQPASVRPASLREGRALFMVLYSIERIINGCTDPGLRDVPRVPPVEVGHELELQGFRLPRSVRIHNVREESTYIVGDLRDEMIFAEQGAADVEGEGAAAGLVDEPEGVEVVMRGGGAGGELGGVGGRGAGSNARDRVREDQ